MKPGDEANREWVDGLPKVQSWLNTPTWSNGVEQGLHNLRYLLLMADAEPGEWVIFGSTVLYLHGLREPETVGDVDAFVSRRVWGSLMRLTPGALSVEVPRAGDPPFLSFALGALPIHLFYDWNERDSAWMDVRECFKASENVNGWQCISLDLMRTQKEWAGTHDTETRPKHVADLEVLNRHLEVGSG